MAKYKLTVAIPTYNRPVQLEKTLLAIVPQVISHENVQLIILDNASKQPAIEILTKVMRGRDFGDRIRVIRNAANIGGVANILHSFELAEGEWLWCSSDDDEPATDAIETILSDSSCDHCYAYYGLKENVPNVSDCSNGKYSGSSIVEWVRRIPSYGHRLFISESVFKVEAMRPYMSLAYIVAASGAPHLVMAYCAISAGGKYLLSSKQIAAYEAPVSGSGYNFARLAYGTAMIGLVAGRGKYADYRIFFKDSYQNWISPTVIFRHMVAIHKNMPSCELRNRFRLILDVFRPSFIESPCCWLKWTICQLFSVAPKLGDKILSLHVK